MKPPRFKIRFTPPPAAQAVLDKLMARGFYKRHSDGSFELTPKCAEPAHKAEFLDLIEELETHDAYKAGSHGGHRMPPRRLQ